MNPFRKKAIILCIDDTDSRQKLLLIPPSVGCLIIHLHYISAVRADCVCCVLPVLTISVVWRDSFYYVFAPHFSTTGR